MLLALAVVACGTAADPSVVEVRHTVHRLQGEALGTTWTVKWVGATPGEEAVGRAVAEALGTVDASMSTWRADSDVSRVRAAEGPIVVSEATYGVVAEALELARATGGAFDPTVQPLVELWGIHGRRREVAPSDEEVAAASARVGWGRVTLGRDAQGRPLLDDGGTALDLNAIAKGYAVDRVSWAMSELGLSNHMVEVGGEVRAHGPGVPAPSGEPAGRRAEGWRLGVQRPDPDLAHGEAVEAVVRVTNAGLATSGNYRNAYVVDGQRVVHTVDPRVGRPVESDVASATVIAPDCATADAVATALMVLGADAGLAWVEARPQVEAYLLVVEGAGFASRASSGMERFVLR